MELKPCKEDYAELLRTREEYEKQYMSNMNLHKETGDIGYYDTARKYWDYLININNKIRNNRLGEGK